jgi:hypothetical protein
MSNGPNDRQQQQQQQQQQQSQHFLELEDVPGSGVDGLDAIDDEPFWLDEDRIGSILHLPAEGDIENRYGDSLNLPSLRGGAYGRPIVVLAILGFDTTHFHVAYITAFGGDEFKNKLTDAPDLKAAYIPIHPAKNPQAPFSIRLADGRKPERDSYLFILEPFFLPAAVLRTFRRGCFAAARLDDESLQKVLGFNFDWIQYRKSDGFVAGAEVKPVLEESPLPRGRRCGRFPGAGSSQPASRAASGNKGASH